TMIMTRTGFSWIITNNFAGLGFSNEAPVVKEWPWVLFTAEGDLSVIDAEIDTVITGLTAWEPQVRETGIYPPNMETINGRDYQEVYTKMNYTFLQYQWGDGLPLTPPTARTVDWILTGTDLDPASTVGYYGKFYPRGNILTVHSLAVALALAGGRPEYLPVLTAYAEAMQEPDFAHESMNTTTCSTWPACIVNGPITRQIRLSCGYGCFGPDPMYPANGPIGRAMRIAQQNIGGAIPATGSMAIYGHNRHTNTVFAEDEGGLPEDWPSLAEERGFPKGSNTVLVAAVAGINNINTYGKGTPPLVGGFNLQNLLYTYQGFMAIPSTNNTETSYYTGEIKGKDAGILVVPRYVARAFSDGGWSKQAVKQWLYENACVIDLPNVREWAESQKNRGNLSALGDNWYPVPLYTSPDDVLIAVAGGEQSGHNAYLQHGTSWSVNQVKEIKLPSNWDLLIEQAEKDLGPRQL
ncbi:MAG: hypothetical protein WCS64_05500, partial [Dehalococcoidales bacterium]